MKILLILIFFALSFPLPTRATECHDTIPTVTFAGWTGESSELRRGFFVWDEVNCWKIPSLPLVDYSQHTPPYFETRAIWQSSGVIEVSAAFNGLDMNGVDGFVALNNCDLVGSDVSVRAPGHNWLRVRVADCVMPVHEYYHAVYVGSGIELSWELAHHYGAFDQDNPGGGVGIYGFEVCVVEPCSGTPVNYTEWYLEQVRRIRSARR